MLDPDTVDEVVDVADDGIDWRVRVSLSIFAQETDVKVHADQSVGITDGVNLIVLEIPA